MINYYYVQKNGVAFSSPIELETNLEEKNKIFQMNSFLENEEFIISNKIIAHIRLEQNEYNNSIIGFIGENYFNFKADEFDILFQNKFLDITLKPFSYSYSSLLFIAKKNNKYKEKSDRNIYIIFNDGSKLFLENILYVDKKEEDCYIITTNTYTYYVCQVSLFIHYSNIMDGDLSLNLVYMDNHICIPNIRRNYLKIDKDKNNDIVILRNKLIENPFIDFVYIKSNLSTVFYTKDSYIKVLPKDKNIKVIQL